MKHKWKFAGHPIEGLSQCIKCNCLRKQLGKSYTIYYLYGVRHIKAPICDDVTNLKRK